MSFNQRIPTWGKDRIQRRIAALSVDGWTPLKLLRFVQSIIGAGLAATADQFGMSREECLRQWDRVYPQSYRGITNQTALIAELRAAATKDHVDVNADCVAQAHRIAGF